MGFHSLATRSVESAAPAAFLPVHFSCSAMLAVPNAALRQELNQTLHRHGVESLVSTGNLMTAADAVANGGLDLLICDLDIAEGNMCNLVREVREAKIGDNPFVAIIVLVNWNNASAAKEAVNCGADDVLVKPFDKETIVERLLKIKEHRPLFVATSGYIGPDRRSAARQNDDDDRFGVKPFLVPNSLNHNISNFHIQDRARHSILAAKRIMNEQRVRVSAVVLSDMIQSLVTKCDENKPLAADQRKNLKRLGEIAGDIFRRAATTPYSQIGAICKMVADMAGDMCNRPDAAFDETDLTLLAKIPGLFVRSFKIKEGELSNEQAEVDRIMEGR